MKPNPPANCPKCGSQSLAINPGSGPHAARIDCEGCKRFVKWVSKADAQKLGLKLDGRAEAGIGFDLNLNEGKPFDLSAIHEQAEQVIGGAA